MTNPTSPDRPPVELQALVHLFYDRCESLATFEEVSGDEVPAPYRGLLDHSGHMTVTVEEFHGVPVLVLVHRYQQNEADYHREITLHRTDNHQVVQYGIVRLHQRYLALEVWAGIASRKIPLGRVLIEHQVMREVELVALWRVVCGPALSQLLRCSEETETYGRTALIHCDGQPAIELLEIVAPVTDSLPG